MDYDFLVNLRRNHPAWRLLAADLAPLVIGFLHRAFVHPNVRALAEQDAASQLDDYLHHLRERLGEPAPARAARDYLAEWADNAHGRLRRYYPPDSDEPHYDLTPAAERAIHWLAGLAAHCGGAGTVRRSHARSAWRARAARAGAGGVRVARGGA